MSPTISQILSVLLVTAMVLGSQLAPTSGASTSGEQPVDPSRQVSATVPHPSLTSSPIDSCQIIDLPGRYHLVADLVSYSYTCLDIVADDVVVDGRGHELTVSDSARALGKILVLPTPDHFGEAIVVSGDRSNVTVANLSFHGFDVGIRSTGGTDHTIGNIDGTNTVTGIVLDGVDGIQVTSTTIRGSAEDGLVVRNATDVAIVDLTVDSSYFAGLVVDSSRGVSIDSTTVSRNHGDGLLVHNSTDVFVTGLRASQNAVGALVIDASETTFSSSSFDRNSIAGIAVGRADGVTITDSIISNTVGDPGAVAVEQTAGLLAIQATNITIREVEVFNNRDWTIAATDSSTVVVDRIYAGSTVLSLTVTDVSIDLDSLVDRPCAESNAKAVIAEHSTRDHSTGGAISNVTVACSD